VTQRPNILIIQADQFAPQAAALHGGPARVPALEALAERASVFTNAYCNYPLCAPSRFSMLSGRMPFSIGAYDNAAEFASSTPTFLHHLRLSGYHTSLSGKMHFIGADQLHGFEQRLTTDIYPADFAWLPNWETRSQNWAPIRDSVERGGVSAYNMQLAFDEDATFQAVRKIYEYARSPEQPFCMFVSLTHPHHPFLAPPRYWDMYEDDALPGPTVERLPDDAVDPHSARAREVIGVAGSDVTTEQSRRARHAYFAAISYFDDKVADLLGALDASQILDDTAVVVVSDHGEMLGERGLWAKDCFFEWAMRIPMIVAPPGAGPSTEVEAPVSLLDLFPTVLDLAGIDHDDVEGTSMLSPGDGSSDVVAEYSAEAAIAPAVMIRRGRYKYIHCDADPPMMFDLDTDPHELTNIVDDPDHHAIRVELEGAVDERWSLSDVDTAVRRSQKERAVVSDALLIGEQTSWDHQPRPDYSRLYVRGRQGGESADQRVRVPAKDYPWP